MKYHFILNPHAGKGNKIGFYAEKVKEICEKEGLDYNIHETLAPCEATEYVKKELEGSSDTHRFYSFGGDGTLNEILNGAFGHENAEIGLIPIGTGNDFCRNFTEKEFFFDIEKQIKGTAEKVDVLKYNDKYCMNMINVGFDCNVAYNTQAMKEKRFIPNKLAYVAALVKTLFEKMYSHQTITVDGETMVDREVLLTAIANGSFCGGGFNAVPYASVTDSTLDVSIVEKISRIKFISLVASYKKGTHLEKPVGKRCVSYIRASSLKMEFDREMRICIDGEIEMASTIDISVVPKAISFVIPEGSSIISKDHLPELKKKVVNLTR
ncbi:MAG: diacylglycerol kinase family lipid kinase [Clostridia bacterium]|jgi:YegS/Rv2252/BmrU family lipid kinase|nr:diacylglycerol kinase family lipid kinase [Clostridia bacterium]